MKCQCKIVNVKEELSSLGIFKPSSQHKQIMTLKDITVSLSLIRIFGNHIKYECFYQVLSTLIPFTNASLMTD